MSFSVNQNGTFHKIIESLKDLELVEINMNVTEDGLYIECMNANHTCLISMNLDHTYFMEFKCDNEKVSGINIQVLHKILKASSDQDLIEFYLKDSELDIKVTSTDDIQEFSIPLLDIQQEEFGISDDQYKYSVKLSSDDFTRLIQKVSVVEGMDCIISKHKSSICFESSGDLGKTKLNHSFESSKIISNEDENDIRNIYSIKHLKKFIKSGHINNKDIQLDMGDGYPIKLMIDIDENSYLKYYIAPKEE